MPDTYFPISIEPACQLKWTWSTIHLYTGETNSCHRVNEQKIDPENFQNFHNLPKKVNDRKLMLDGIWPAGGCEYCKDIEASGGKSDRMFQKEIPNLSPPELINNPLAVEVSPRIVEVYLNNICNMSCIYCEDKFSSKIEQENIRFGEFKIDGLEIKNNSKKTENFEKLTSEFWKWINKNYLTLRRLHILGGEPFYQKEFNQCLDFLESHSNPNLEFNIVSNLKLSHDKLVIILERIKNLIVQNKIKRFDLTASIDCWGESQEYIRYGINFEQWKKNFEYICGQKWITVNINQTITSLSLDSTVKLIEYINTFKKQRKIGHYFMYCKKPSFFNPAIFPKNFFNTHLDAIINTMETETWQGKHAKDLMIGFKHYFNSNDGDNLEIKKLIMYLNELDRRRNLNWRLVFPWLIEFEHVV